MKRLFDLLVIMLFFSLLIAGCSDNAAEDLAMIEPSPDDTPEFTMIQVGTPGKTYTIPTGVDDSGTAEVEGGFEISTTLVTYELWYEVRIWAEKNGYYFENLGMEGSVTGGGDKPDYKNIGQPPTEAKHEPVTMISWQDMNIWLNALSEKQGLEPVYRTIGQYIPISLGDDVIYPFERGGDIIRDARDYNVGALTHAAQTDHNGYRLPTSMEWEMAARWENDTPLSDNSIELDGKWWTPGSFASGAKAPYGWDDPSAQKEVAWFWDNSDTGQGVKTQPVGQKKPNALGLYDMSGNVVEWTYTKDRRSLKIVRGEGHYKRLKAIRVGYETRGRPTSVTDFSGFRIARCP